jgi:hypothetical protein
VPSRSGGKQRVLRGDGKVRSIGKVLWTGLIESFPGLTNEVTSIHADDAGNVAAEMTIAGTQAKVWGAIGCRGKRFAVDPDRLDHRGNLRRPRRSPGAGRPRWPPASLSPGRPAPETYPGRERQTWRALLPVKRLPT